MKQRAEKCTKKREVLLIKPIVFLTFSLPSTSLDLKVPNIYPVENHARKSFTIESEFCNGKRTVSNGYQYSTQLKKLKEKEKLLRLRIAKRNGANLQIFQPEYSQFPLKIW